MTFPELAVLAARSLIAAALLFALAVAVGVWLQRIGASHPPAWPDDDFDPDW